MFSYIGYDLTDTTLTTQMLSFLFYSRCSNKWCSPFIENLIEEDDDGEKEISVQNLQMLGQYIKGILKPNWDKFKAITLEDYDPIHNFSNTTVETISDEKSNTRTDNLTRTDSFTSSNERVEDIDTTEQVEKSDSSSGENGVYGFNSDDSVGSDTTSSELASSITTDKDGSITTTDSGSNGGTSKNTGTQSDEGTFERERETTQTGNIGNLSTQKLLTEEIELWQWNFAEQMVTDVMRLLTLSVY